MVDSLGSLEKLVNVGIALKHQSNVLFYANQMDLIIGDNVRAFVNLPLIGSIDYILQSLKRIAAIWKALAQNYLGADELLSLLTRGIKALGDLKDRSQMEILEIIDALVEIRKNVDREGVNLQGLDEKIGGTVRALAAGGLIVVASPAR